MLDLTSLPWLPLDQRNFFPCRPAVYLVISGTGNVLYIGRSEEVSSRWRSHEKLRHLKLLYGVRIAFVFTESENLRNLEAELISEYKPSYNLRVEKLQIAAEGDRVQFLRDKLQFSFALSDRGLLEVFKYLLKLINQVKNYTKKLAKHFFSAPPEEQEKLVWWLSGLAEISVLGDNLIDSLKSRADVRMLLRQSISKDDVKYYLEALQKRCPQDFAQAVADLDFEWRLFMQAHGSLLLEDKYLGKIETFSRSAAEPQCKYL